MAYFRKYVNVKAVTLILPLYIKIDLFVKITIRGLKNSYKYFEHRFFISF